LQRNQLIDHNCVAAQCIAFQAVAETLTLHWRLITS
jgi:hypothetical protein